MAARSLGALVVAARDPRPVSPSTFFDAEKLRDPLQKQASAALGRDVTLGKISLALFPLPAVRVGDVRIAGPKPSDPPFAEIAELRLRVAILPLLARKVVLRALEIDSPRINIPFDKDGKPILPGPAKTAEKPKPAPAEKPPAEAPAAVGGPRARGRPDRDRTTRDVQAGPWLVEHAKHRRAPVARRQGAFQSRLDLPGLAELRDGELELAELTAAAPQVDARRASSAPTSRS